MSINHHQPNDEQLKALLVADEQSNEYRLAAVHVDSCTACQQRLTTLAADEQGWDEIRNLLSGEMSVSDRSMELSLKTSPAHDQTEVDRRNRRLRLDFLDPPSHPEMLGRLDRYEIERVIGSGGMGIVLRAFDTELNRPVAIKVLAAHLAHSGAARQRFAREARAAAAVVHEHVVPIHNVQSSGEVPFLVMHFVAGESLQARVDRDGPLDAKEILRIGIQAAAGLAAAHEQGVIHRDVKPANIMLEEGVERVLLTDFGLARTADDASLTHTGIIAGTPHYMSPEQAGMGETDRRTDLFSLGAVLYFMATGRPPFRAERAMGVLNRICRDPHRPVWHVNADIPDELSDIIDRLLQKKPHHRFATATDAKQAMSAALSKIQQCPRRRHRRAFRLLRRHPWSLGITAGVLALVLTAGLLFTKFSANSPPAAPNDRETPSPLDAANTAEYEALRNEIEHRIEQLESLNGNSFFSGSQGDSDWNEEVRSINARLDQLKQELFSQPVGSHVKGKE